MAAFPSTFPCPAVEPFSMTLDAGLIRDAFPSSMSRQRRRYKTMPRSVEIKWSVSQPMLGQVLPWLNDYGFRWFSLNLPSDLAGNSPTVPHLIRLTSDISSSLIKYSMDKVTDCWWELRVQAEVVRL
jgi:hypothetical protein